MRPGLYMSFVPVYEICIVVPLVMLSRRRRKEISCGARPGFVGEEERMLEIATGRPVSVERTSRWARDLCDVKRRYSGAGAAIVLCGLVRCAGCDGGEKSEVNLPAEYFWLLNRDWVGQSPLWSKTNIPQLPEVYRQWKSTSKKILEKFITKPQMH